MGLHVSHLIKKAKNLYYDIKLWQQINYLINEVEGLLFPMAIFHKLGYWNKIGKLVVKSNVAKKQSKTSNKLQSRGV